MPICKPTWSIIVAVRANVRDLSGAPTSLSGRTCLLVEVYIYIYSYIVIYIYTYTWRASPNFDLHFPLAKAAKQHCNGVPTSHVDLLVGDSRSASNARWTSSASSWVWIWVLGSFRLWLVWVVSLFFCRCPCGTAVVFPLPSSYCAKLGEQTRRIETQIRRYLWDNPYMKSLYRKIVKTMHIINYQTSLKDPREL